MEIDKIKKMALGEVSEQEREEVEAWGSVSDERNRFVKNARTFYAGEGISEEEIARRMERIWKTMPLPLKRRRVMYRWVTVAACLILGIATGLSFWLSRSEEETAAILAVQEYRPQGVQLLLSDGSKHELTSESRSGQIPGFSVDAGGMIRQERMTGEDRGKPGYDEILVPRGGEYTFMLADGTKVTLNAETRLRFPNTFGEKERQVFLEGEAYFEVAKEQERPFLVTFQEGSVRVLGTQFNVKAYEGQDAYATLVNGKVEVASGEEAVILKPGQQCQILTGKKHNLTVGEADLMVVLAWKNGEFVFKNAPLEQVLEELSRWYNVEIGYDKSSFQGMQVHIYMNRSQTLEEALDMLSKAWDIRYEMQGKKIIIKKQ